MSQEPNLRPDEHEQNLQNSPMRGAKSPKRNLPDSFTDQHVKAEVGSSRTFAGGSSPPMGGSSRSVRSRTMDEQSTSQELPSMTTPRRLRRRSSQDRGVFHGLQPHSPGPRTSPAATGSNRSMPAVALPAVDEDVSRPAALSSPGIIYDRHGCGQPINKYGVRVFDERPFTEYTTSPIRASSPCAGAPSTPSRQTTAATSFAATSFPRFVKGAFRKPNEPHAHTGQAMASSVQHTMASSMEHAMASSGKLPTASSVEHVSSSAEHAMASSVERAMSSSEQPVSTSAEHAMSPSTKRSDSQSFLGDSDLTFLNSENELPNTNILSSEGYRDAPMDSDMSSQTTTVYTEATLEDAIDAAALADDVDLSDAPQHIHTMYKLEMCENYLSNLSAPERQWNVGHVRKHFPACMVSIDSAIVALLQDLRSIAIWAGSELDGMRASVLDVDGSQHDALLPEQKSATVYKRTVELAAEFSPYNVINTEIRQIFLGFRSASPLWIRLNDARIDSKWADVNSHFNALDSEIIMFSRLQGDFNQVNAAHYTKVNEALAKYKAEPEPELSFSSMAAWRKHRASAWHSRPLHDKYPSMQELVEVIDRDVGSELWRYVEDFAKLDWTPHMLSEVTASEREESGIEPDQLLVLFAYHAGHVAGQPAGVV